MVFDRIKGFFKKKQQYAVSNIPSANTNMPPMETIIEMMYDKQLDFFNDEVVQTIYSKDKARRYVVLKNKNGFFTYRLEAIYQFDEYELGLVSSNNNVLPAMWEPHSNERKSIFASEDELLKELKSESEYKLHF